MKEPSRRRWPVPLGLVALLALVVLAATGCPKPPEIAEGTDCWHTESGTFQKLPTLPANFFGPRSEAIPNPVVQFEGVPLDPDFVAAPYPEGCGCPEEVDVTLTWVDRHGSPVSGDSAHRVKQVPNRTTDIDTCIRRKTMAKLNPHAAVKVDIELVALSLKSVDPLEVTYKGEPPHGEETTKAFDVFVTKSSTPPPSGSSMTFTPGASANNGEISLDDLRIAYDVEFQEVGGSGVFTKTGLNTRLRSDPAHPGNFHKP